MVTAPLDCGAYGDLCDALGDFSEPYVCALCMPDPSKHGHTSSRRPCVDVPSGCHLGSRLPTSNAEVSQVRSAA